jgi:hypothetical protein
MNNESRLLRFHLSKEYTFWFHVMHKCAFAFPWNMPKELVKVVVSESNISSDGSIWINSQNTLDVSLPNIAKIKLIISTGQIGTLEIITQESKRFLLVPTNPFDPTLLSHSNVDEIMAFIGVVEALKANRSPDVDENPYIRQFQKMNKPAYLANKVDFLWDKNISPWKYYHEFVPESLDKKKLMMARIYGIIVLGALNIVILLALYAIYSQFER